MCAHLVISSLIVCAHYVISPSNMRTASSLFIILFTISLIHILRGKQHGLTNCSCGGFEEDSLETKIKGGVILKPLAHWFMAIVTVGGDLVCGGSIVGPRHVMTAGHCLFNVFTPTVVKVLLGVHDRLEEDSYSQQYDIEKLIIHEKFQITARNILINDIALLQTSKVIEFNKYIKPICLPFALDVSRHKAAKVAGWGVTEFRGKISRMPRGALLSLLTTEQCRKSDLGSVLSKVPHMFDYILCAYKLGSDACQGDSGGPLYVHDADDNVIQIGIVSFGVKCGTPGKPGIYTKLTNYVDWIKTKLNGQYCNKPSN